MTDNQYSSTEITDLVIRRMKQIDIPAVERIEVEAFSDPWSRETLVEALEIFPDTVFVAENRGSITGCIICGIEDTGEERYGHLCSLAVSPVCHGRGIGTALVKRAEYQMLISKATAMQLEVRISNQTAQKFYKNRGYEPVFQIDQYYANQEDAIVMMKWFRI